jgi:O-antigen ligase
MEKTRKPDLIFYLLVFITAVLPLTISRYFFNVNDLPKSTVLMVIGGLIVILTSVYLIQRIFNEKFLVFNYAGLPDYSILLFILSLIISTIFSLRPYISFFGQYERQFGLITYLFAAALYFIAGFVLNNNYKITRLLLVMEFISVLISAYAVLQAIQIDPIGLQPLNVRPVSMLGNSVFLGGFLILSLPFSLLNSSCKKNAVLKVLFPLIIFAGIIVTGTRSAYSALVIQLIFFIVINFKGLKSRLFKNKRILIAAIIPAVLMLFYFFTYYNEGMLFIRIKDIFLFKNPRLTLWKDSINVFYKYPFTGTGIAMFSAAFEEFYSMKLRYMVVNYSHDHAHNNYLQILYTAGIVGFLSYIFFLLAMFKNTISSFRKKRFDNIPDNISIAVFLMLCGYCFYGLTNFDDISITFYLFLYLGVLRSVIAKEKTASLNKIKLSLISVLALLIIAGCLINGYKAINNLLADRNFYFANVEFNRGDFKKSLEFNNKAILLNPECSAYRFTEAMNVYDYCFMNTSLNPGAKQKLLIQAEDEITRIKSNLYFVNYCDGLLSLIYYEEGRITEADKLKEAVLAKDSLNINYRFKLARFQLKANKTDEAFTSINLILLVMPNDVNSYILAAEYYLSKGKKDEAIENCRKGLSIDEGNIYLLNILKELN